MKENTPGEALPVFLERVLLWQLLLVVATGVLLYVGNQTFLGFLFAIGLSGVAYFLDEVVLATIPTPVPQSVEDREFEVTIARTTWGLYAFFFVMAIIVAEPDFGLLMMMAFLKLLFPICYAVRWYGVFVREVFPALRVSWYDLQAREAAARAEIAKLSVPSRPAVNEARQMVLKFYKGNCPRIREFIGEVRLGTEIRAEIPDSADENQAFEGARRLLSRLEELVEAGAGRRRHAEEQIAAIDHSIQKLRTSDMLDDDVREAEIEALESRRRVLVAEEEPSQRS